MLLRDYLLQTGSYIYYLAYVIGYRVILMENIPCAKHEAFPGMIIRISTCNEARDSHEENRGLP